MRGIGQPKGSKSKGQTRDSRSYSSPKDNHQYYHDLKKISGIEGCDWGWDYLASEDLCQAAGTTPGWGRP